MTAAVRLAAALILLAAITGTLGNSLWILALALAVVSIPAYTRIVRGATQSPARAADSRSANWSSGPT